MLDTVSPIIPVVVTTETFAEVGLVESARQGSDEERIASTAVKV